MSANQKVLAIGIDSPSNEQFEAWIDQGFLPNLQKLKKQSLYGHVEHTKLHSNQNSWLPFLTAINIEKLDYLLSNYDPKNYSNQNNSLHNLRGYEPFYALDDLRVVMFDLPVAISERVNGVQIVGWASDLNESYSSSKPEDLISTIEKRYGPDPKQDSALSFFNEKEGKYGRSYRVPSAYDLGGLESFKRKLIQSVETRGLICKDLMANHSWDLFITCFSEIHVAGHTLWHLSQDHPIDALKTGVAGDPLLEIYRCVDVQIGALVDSVQADVSVVLFTVDSVVSDGLESPRSIFLPELLYRWNFPDKAAIAPGRYGDAVPAPGLKFNEHWKHEVWKLRTPLGERELQSPMEQERQKDTFSWQPTNWYKPVWRRMKAFALPSVSDGYVRINVRGREEGGLVDPQDYDAICDEIAEMLMQAIDARTGDRIISKVLRVRKTPFESNSRQSPADLIVLFREEMPTDTVDSPGLGRIGPVPFFRPGGHQKQGSSIRNCFMVRLAESVNGEISARGSLEDIPATIAALLGKSLDEGRDGKSLLQS